MRIPFLMLVFAACVACRGRDTASNSLDSAIPASTATVDTWSVSALANAPPRFRPAAWSSEDVLWGLVRGRLTRLDTRSGSSRAFPITAWWIKSAQDVVAWRNEHGTWLMRDDSAAAPSLMAGPDGDPTRRGDGPSVLLSPDGKRIVLGWEEEWDTHHELLEPDGSKRQLETRIRGFYLNGAVLWLDSTRILFHIVANGPIGGEPTYRESGWRAPLAIFDLRTSQYKIVADVPELTRLHVAGRYRGDILVTEWDTTGIRGHYLYDTNTWQRRTLSLPKGRAFSSVAGAVVILLLNEADITDAVLVANGQTQQLGRVARDAEPAFTPSGRRGVVHTSTGIKVFEATRATP